MNIEVNRLRFKGASESPHHQAFLIEDALNTLLSGEQRLVLVRRIELDRPAGVAKSDSRAIVARNVAQGWARIMGSACHGGSDSAASANVVWFADAEEAKAILIARLLKNQSVDAWFWRLAVKLWRGQPLEQWVADEMRAADQMGAPGQAVGMIVRLLQAGRVEVAEAALLLLLAAPVNDGQWRSTPFVHTNSFAPLPSEFVSNPTSAKQRKRQSAQVAMWLPQFRSKLPPDFSRMLRRLSTQIADRVPLIGLVERFLSRFVPELSLQAELLRIAAQHFLDAAVAEQPLSSSPKASQTAQPSGHRAGETPNPETQSAHQAATDATPILKDEGRTKRPPDKIEAPHSSDSDDFAPFPEPQFDVERRSSAAGLFYLFNPLRELGWPQWLVSRPALLGANPTAQLLDAIAKHHGVTADDPAFAFLRERIDNTEPIDPEILRLWRIALDRWLKRKARIKLARLIGKSGWLHWQGDRILVRFRLSDIDIRLRRCAIDRDPGWVMWAGLSVRYNFSDHPLYADELI